MSGQCGRPNVMLDLGWPDGALALVLEGFALETLLITTSQHHWSGHFRPQCPEDCASRMGYLAAGRSFRYGRSGAACYLKVILGSEVSAGCPGELWGVQEPRAT